MAYSRCLQLLLSEEILCKKGCLCQSMLEYDRIKQKPLYQLSAIVFIHVITDLVSNVKATLKSDKIHGRTLQKLIPNIRETSIIDNVSDDPNKVIYNFLDYKLMESDKALLIKVVNFSIPSKKIEYSQFLLLFELPFCNIKV